MMRPFLFLFLLAAAATVAADVSTRHKFMKLKVAPEAFAFAPAEVEVQLRVEPGGRGREVLLQLEGPDYSSASRLSIDANPTAPASQHPTRYRDIPAGDYIVAATLSDCASEGCGRRQVLERETRRLQILEGVRRR